MPLTSNVLPVKKLQRQPELFGVASDFVQRGQAVIDIKCRVLHSLGHHRSGKLLKLHYKIDHLAAVYDVKMLQVVEQERFLDKVEEGPRGTRVSLLRLFHGSRNIFLIPFCHPARRRIVVGAIDGKAGDDLANGKGQAVKRKVSIVTVPLGDAIELMS